MESGKQQWPRNVFPWKAKAAKRCNKRMVRKEKKKKDLFYKKFEVNRNLKFIINFPTIPQPLLLLPPPQKIQIHFPPLLLKSQHRMGRKKLQNLFHSISLLFCIELIPHGHICYCQKLLEGFELVPEHTHSFSCVSWITLAFSTWKRFFKVNSGFLCLTQAIWHATTIKNSYLGVTALPSSPKLMSVQLLHLSSGAEKEIFPFFIQGTIKEWEQQGKYLNTPGSMETALVQFLSPIKKSLPEKTADEKITDFQEGLTEGKGQHAWRLVKALPARPAATFLTIETGRDGYYRDSKRNLFAPRSPEE